MYFSTRRFTYTNIWTIVKRRFIQYTSCNIKQSSNTVQSPSPNQTVPQRTSTTKKGSRSCSFKLLLYLSLKYEFNGTCLKSGCFPTRFQSSTVLNDNDNVLMSLNDNVKVTSNIKTTRNMFCNVSLDFRLRYLMSSVFSETRNHTDRYRRIGIS